MLRTALAAACLGLGLSVTGAAQGATAVPAWQLTITAWPSNLASGASGAAEETQGFAIVATNVGGADTTGEITLTDELPAGLSPASSGCDATGQLVRCTDDEVVHPGGHIAEFIPVVVGPGLAGSSLENTVALEGGQAKTVAASVETQVGAAAPAFGFLPGAFGLDGLLNGRDGGPVNEAGSTPYQLTIDVGLPSKISEGLPVNAGHPRDLSVDLPPGLVFDPAATPSCSEGQLAREACPPASEIGRADITTLPSVTLQGAPLYNIDPPPGYASDFGFQPKESGLRYHLLGSIRADEFGLSAAVDDILAKYFIGSIQLQLWGYPADPAHDTARGGPVEARPVPLITLPSACGPLGFSASVDSWESPGSYISRSVPLEDLAGDPVEVEGCTRLEFEPSLSLQPTTTTADSAGGLDLKLEVPQRAGPEGSTTSSLRRATVTLPPGMTLNPAAAGGLAACTPGEIGLLSPVGQPEARFDDASATCPDASKLGTVEAVAPLLQDETEEGRRSPRPLTGAVYLAQPRQNPFDSTFALYAGIEDPETGTVLKLAGEVKTDPATGQVTATFGEVPQLSFEAFKLDFFGGPQGVLRTPAVCGSYSSHGAMTPWSGTATVQDESRFSIAASPSDGACATASGQLPNSPRFAAGSVLTAAGRYSPLVLDLSRGDGSQELGALEVTMPAGLIGRLAGTTRCSDAALSAAAHRSGREEEASPSCPAASRVGRVAVAVGAGSSPYEAGGSVYLAGPYKGAPLSLAVLAPAIAGPFDLGTVVVRAAVFVDPTTGRLTVKSDPLPSMLAGVPLDVRSLRLEINKPDLIRNPTSCEPMAITGSATSSIGQVAALSSRFQVGGCAALTFKPKLSLGLSGALGRGGHPALRAVLRTDPEGAALKSASFALPAGELLDLKHVRALCPRKVAVGGCPSASRLGSVSIHSPALEAPLQGPVYLRVPSHRLPDLVGEVRSEGLSFLLRGRTTDSEGRLGVKLESLPDIPLSQAILSLAGGRRGILVNSHSLCRGTGAVAASFGAHDGKVRRLHVHPHARGC